MLATKLVHTRCGAVLPHSSTPSSNEWTEPPRDLERLGVLRADCDSLFTATAISREALRSELGDSGSKAAGAIAQAL